MEFTSEKYTRLTKRSLCAAIVHIISMLLCLLTFAAFIVFLVLMLLRVGGREVDIAVIVCLVVCYISLSVSEYMGRQGFSSPVWKISEQTADDILSDSTIALLQQKAGSTIVYPDRCFYLIMLADSLYYRGQIADSVNTLYAVDKSRFDKYPLAAMEYYTTLMQAYCVCGDIANAEALYRDAKPFFERYYEKKMQYYGLAAYFEWSVSLLRKDHESAENAIRNSFAHLLRSCEKEETEKKTSSQNLRTRLAKGSVLLYVAEISMLKGDTQKAKLYADSALPLLTGCPFLISRAENIRKELSENTDDIHETDSKGDEAGI